MPVEQKPRDIYRPRALIGVQQRLPDRL